MLREVWDELLGLPGDPASFWSLSWGSKAVVGVALAAGLHVVVKFARGGRRRRYQDPPNTLVLVCGPKGPYAPSLVPFAVKLETFCRMADIPYQAEREWSPSAKGKLPWLRYNGEEVADSSFCIQFLSRKFSKDLNSGLTSEQKAMGRAFTKMLEENTYWTMVLERWTDGPEFFLQMLGGTVRLLGYLFWLRACRFIRDATWKHGIGRHSRQERNSIMEADLEAVSLFLGNKDFLFGKQPCEADCAVFGQLSQFLWHMPGMVGEEVVREKFPNLRAYCLRMKERYWPDWDQVASQHRDV